MEWLEFWSCAPPEPHQIGNFSGSSLRIYSKPCITRFSLSNPTYWYTFQKEFESIDYTVVEKRLFTNMGRLSPANQDSYWPKLFDTAIYEMSHTRKKCALGRNWRFVQKVVVSRNCGQGLARLDDSRHNTTKQRVFPTTWRKLKKYKLTQMNKACL